MGDDVTIVEANRLRRGGVAGFFAKERFEVFVTERPEGPAAAAPRRFATRPAVAPAPRARPGARGRATSPRVLATAGVGRTAMNGPTAATLVDDDRVPEDELGAAP